MKTRLLKLTLSAFSTGMVMISLAHAIQDNAPPVLVAFGVFLLAFNILGTFAGYDLAMQEHEQTKGEN